MSRGRVVARSSHSTQVQNSVTAAFAFKATGVDMSDLINVINGYRRPEHTQPGYFGERHPESPCRRCSAYSSVLARLSPRLSMT